MRGAAVLLVSLIGCSSAPVVREPAPSTDDAVPSQADAPSDPPSAIASQAEPLPEEPNPVAVRINAKYEASDDARGWEKRFERQGREVHDKREAVVAALKISPGDAVADVGVGSGLYTLRLAEAVGPTGTVFGVDVQDYFLAHVEAKAKDAGVENITFVKAAQRSSNLNPASLDLVFICDVFHHVEYPRTYLASLYAALEPGGRMAVIDYIAEEGTSEAWVLDHVRASPAEFRAEFEAAGFVFVEAPELLEENFFHIYQKPK
ncbi:MAG: class I SAM-dependent methyltransferase [Nannocystaceae bacterium]|nr:methyltransferase domain-containing protein [bacterium]